MLNFLEIVRFEVVLRARQMSTWVGLAMFAALGSSAASGMLVEEAQRAGDLHANGPGGIAFAHVIVSMFGLVITAGLFSGAALRDRETRMHPLFVTLPISKTHYLGGRFAGALLVNVLLASIVPLALMFALRPAFVDAELLGPFRAGAFLQPFVYILLPNVFVTGALLFAVAVLTQRTLPVFAAAIFLFAGGMCVEELVAEQMGRGALATLLDPFGFSVMSELAELWTTHEKNTRTLTFDGALLWNRVVWMSAAALVLVATRWRFRIDAHASREKMPRDEVAAPAAPARIRVATHPSAPRQLLAIAGESFRALAFSRDFLLIAIGLMALVALLTASISDNFGVPFWPLTQFLAPALGSFFPAIVVSLLTIFYAGEVLHRERDGGLAEIFGSTPVPEWARFAGKFLGLAMLVAALQAVLLLAALLVQAANGWFRFELGLYAKIVFGLQLSDYLLLAALAMLLHVLVDHKYAGHLIAVLAYAFTVFASRLGVGHNLLIYGGDPGWVYSDISGFGPFLGPVLWFRLYWTGWALLFAVIAIARLSRWRFGRGSRVLATIALVTIVATGAFIFYNTNVLSTDRSPEKIEASRAEYERLYGKYKTAAQPTVRGTKLHVELYPDERIAHVRGTYALVNATAEPIRAVHLFLDPEVRHRAIAFDRQARLTIADDARGHRTYELARPLQRGESLQMQFETRFEPRGFPNDDINTAVVGNGTYFDHTGGRNPNHRRWLPLVGYQANREVDTTGSDGPGGREWIDFEATIGTVANQTAIAPGTLRRTWTEDGRRYFHYATERPVKNAFAIFSAKYAVHAETWKGVRIEIVHHPAHAMNVPRFARAARASLDAYTTHFGPYPHRQLRIVEFPRYASFAYAYPGTISYAEAFGWLTNVDEENGFDLPTAVVAHEAAHQWWGYQVVPAPGPGAGVLSEVLAQYSALMVTEKLYGPEMVERFLGTTRIEYLNRRGTAAHPEVPLLEVTTHANLVYRKGPLAMWALRHFIGEERLNAALRRFLQRHGAGQPRYPVAHDLYRELQAETPREYHYLLDDLLAKNTLWQFRATAASATRASDGTWRVALDVEAHKLRFDGRGKESEVPMRDFVEIGVFAPTTNPNDLGEPLYLAKHRIRSGWQRLTIAVKGEPGKAGIDPGLHLIDRNWTDNVRRVSVAGR